MQEVLSMAFLVIQSTWARISDTTCRVLPKTNTIGFHYVVFHCGLVLINVAHKLQVYFTAFTAPSHYLNQWWLIISEVLCFYCWFSTIMFTRYMYNKILQLGYTQFRHTIAHLQGQDMYLLIFQIMILIVALLLPHSMLCIVIMFHAMMRFDHTKTFACPMTVMDKFKWENMESSLLTAISTSITLSICWWSNLGFVWNIY